ncbi:MAG: ComEC/Rec2 family competence protein [Candidatus Komeilibacteria bacterium]|nr:ComEC/Rec2 family competence protein [Candidatus Komeilibacteria bacterium]
MEFRKSQLVFYSCLAFVLGVAVASFFYIPWLIVYFIVLAGINLLIFGRSKSLLLLSAFCLLFFAFGLARYQLSLPIIDKNHLIFYNGQQITFQGIVSDEPDIRVDHVKLKIKGLNLKGNVLVKAALIPQYNYGDVLEIKCLLNRPEPIEDFEYDKYLAKSDIYSTCYNGQIKLVAAGRGGLLKTAIFKIKNKMVAIAGQILPEPQSSFLGGLLWGAKKGMPQEILDNFNRTGVTHIIAVSGYNITIIAAALSGLFIGLGLSKRRAFWLIVLVIAFFVIITGWPASIIRAGLMGVIFLMSQVVGRAAKMQNTLALTGLIMLLINPKILIWDAGFQLSFVSTLGLIYLSPHLAKRLNFLPNFLGLKDSLSTTLSAIIFTSPLILWQFGRFSVVAPLTNLLILPVIPLVMFLGFISVILGLIYLPIGQIMAWPTWLVLTYILKAIGILAGWRWSAISL